MLLEYDFVDVEATVIGGDKGYVRGLCCVVVVWELVEVDLVGWCGERAGVRHGSWGFCSLEQWGWLWLGMRLSVLRVILIEICSKIVYRELYEERARAAY